MIKSPNFTWRKAPVALYLVMAVCATPFFLGVLRLAQRAYNDTTRDLNAVLCAGNAWIHGESFYADFNACPYQMNWPYVYPPPLAMAMGVLERNYSTSFGPLLAGAALGLSLTAMARLLLTGKLTEQIFRAPFYCAITAKTLVSGNFSLLVHALVVLGAANAAFDLLLPPLVVVCAVCKPTLAVYAALFLFMDRPLLTRLAMTGASLAGVLCYFAWFRLDDPATFQAWLDAVRVHGAAVPGHSFFGLPGVAALPAVVRAGLYVAFSAALLAVGLVASRRVAGAGRERMFIGVAVCALLNPRMLFYDQITLPFGMGVIAAHLASGSRRRTVVVGFGLAVIWGCVTGWSGQTGAEILFASCVGLISACALLPAKADDAAQKAG